MSGMKVAFIDCLLTKHASLGVEKKFIERARASLSLGLNTDFFYLNSGRRLQDNRVHFCQWEQGFPRNLFSVLYRYSCIKKHIDTDKYDFLVLRYTGADFSFLSSLVRLHGRKVVTEHHTKELPEAFTYQTTLPQKLLTLLMERFLGPGMIRRCAGLVAISDDVRRYEVERAGVSIPSCAITNGVLVQDMPFSRHAHYDGTVLNLLCLASSFSAWHGLDRVLAGLAKYGSPSPLLSLKVVGNVSPEQQGWSSRLDENRYVKVEFLGRLFGSELEKVFEKTHIGFSSMALFRNNMKEGSPIKTREFVARGLPFVVGYSDPDLEGADDFFMTIPADNSAVNIDEVVAFAEDILKREGVSESMRQFAEEKLDWKVKMLELWDFLESLVS